MGICETFLLQFGVIILLLLENVVCQSLPIEEYNVTLHNNSHSWEEANTICNLAGTDRLDSVQQGLKQFIIPTNISEVWIGAYLEYTPWLNLTGCKIRSFDKNANGINIMSSADPLLECSQHCFGDFFLTYDMCYCSNVPNPPDTPDTQLCKADPCPNNNEQFCGERGINTCVCHYTKFRFNDKGRIGNCMAAVIINQTEIQLQNENCENMYSSACDGLVQFTTMAWAKAGFKCYYDNMQYSSKLNIEEKSSVSQFWIAVMRRPIFRWKTSDEGIMSNCVAASQNITGTWQLKVRPCGDKLPFLCHGEINFNRYKKNVEIYFAIIFGTVGTFIIILVVVLVCRKKNKIRKASVFEKERDNECEIDHVYHDIDPNFYEEDIITHNAVPVCTEGNDGQKTGSYDKVCVEDYGRLNLNAKGNPDVITNYDTMGNLVCTEHSSYGKLLKKNNVCVLSEYDTVEFCKE